MGRDKTREKFKPPKATTEPVSINPRVAKLIESAPNNLKELQDMVKKVVIEIGSVTKLTGKPYNLEEAGQVLAKIREYSLKIAPDYSNKIAAVARDPNRVEMIVDSVHKALFDPLYGRPDPRRFKDYLYALTRAEGRPGKHLSYKGMSDILACLEIQEPVYLKTGKPK